MSEDIAQSAQTEQQSAQTEQQSAQNTPEPSKTEPKKGDVFNAILKRKPVQTEQKSTPEPEKAKEQPSAAEPQKEGDKKEEPQKDDKPADIVHKNGAKERIQQLARERNEYRERAERAEKQVAELENLKKMKEEDKRPKDWAREAVLEEQITAQQNEMRNRLVHYMNSHENPQQFQANYDYYTPLFTQKDPDTIKIISSYPEAIEMLDAFYNAFTQGTATPQQWIDLPLPDKVRRIGILRDSLLQAKEQAASPHPAPAPATQPPQTAKQVPDSVKPIVSNSPNTPHDHSDANKGSTFRRIMGDLR